MTSYHISVGYSSAIDKKEVWEELKKVVDNLREHPEVILSEDDSIPEEFYNAYQKSNTDLTIRVWEMEDIDKCEIIQLASGYESLGSGRSKKEQTRRAVCRYIMKQMHSKGMEININVR